MNRRSFLARCGTSLGAGAGCLDSTAGERRTGTPTVTDTPTATDTAAPTDTASLESADTERHASPHEFVHVEQVSNRTATAAPANETATFENLSRQRRRTFRAALQRERVAADGWSFYNESRPTYVRYNGTWFRVFVAVH
ncbi:hypothetical protein [Haloplanus aerogenes]|uniref:DUF7979 domain-containing protein n=1 Tax=Haloplanus aerogenes TaxID=660522 RepID=A0A3G8QYI2_9EURY|nr:hypothetical protein [Haloplanus aerogenes]AZH26668.1 hypothetical protein DU502_15365 [Haloplanus aerogenes]